MPKKFEFESIEPVFGSHEAGVKAMILVGGRDILHGDLPLDKHQIDRLRQIFDDAEHPWMIEYFESSHPNAARDKIILTSSTAGAAKKVSKGNELGIVGILLLILYFGVGWYWSFNYYPFNWSISALIFNLIFGPMIASFDLFELFILGDCTSAGCNDYLNR